MMFVIIITIKSKHLKLGTAGLSSFGFLKMLKQCKSDTLYIKREGGLSKSKNKSAKV